MIDGYMQLAYEYERLGRREFCRKYNVGEEAAYNIYLKSLAENEEDLALSAYLAGCGED